MVVAFLRGILRKRCDDARDHLAESMILDALESEMSAKERDNMSMISAATLSSCDPKKRGEIMGRVDRGLQRSAQLRRINIFDSAHQIGLRGFGAGQKLSLVKLFRLAKKNSIIQGIHDSCQKATIQE